MDPINDIIERTETNSVNGSIRGKYLKELIIIDCIVEINLASLFATDLGVHDASTSIEAYFLGMRD